MSRRLAMRLAVTPTAALMLAVDLTRAAALTLAAMRGAELARALDAAARDGEPGERERRAASAAERSRRDADHGVRGRGTGRSRPGQWKGRAIFGTGGRCTELLFGQQGRWQVYVFPGKKVAKKAVAGVWVGGTTISAVSRRGAYEGFAMYEFIGSPHHFARGRIIAMYVERGGRTLDQPLRARDERIVEVLRRTMGASSQDWMPSRQTEIPGPGAVGRGATARMRSTNHDLPAVEVARQARAGSAGRTRRRGGRSRSACALPRPGPSDRSPRGAGRGRRSGGSRATCGARPRRRRDGDSGRRCSRRRSARGRAPPTAAGTTRFARSPRRDVRPRPGSGASLRAAGPALPPLGVEVLAAQQGGEGLGRHPHGFPSPPASTSRTSGSSMNTQWR